MPGYNTTLFTDLHLEHYKDDLLQKVAVFRLMCRYYNNSNEYPMLDFRFESARDNISIDSLFDQALEIK